MSSKKTGSKNRDDSVVATIAKTLQQNQRDDATS